MKNYWTNLDENCEVETISTNEEIVKTDKNNLTFLEDSEFVETSTSRRNFLKLCGFSVSAAAIASGCEAPVTNAIPLLIKPEEITPGVANHYASTYFDGNYSCPVLVKVRDGRPIKIEGNNLSKTTNGGTTAQVQASLLNLYDSERLSTPLIKGEKSTWEETHTQVVAHLNAVTKKGEKIIILSTPIISPSTLKALDVFKTKYTTTEVVYYEPISFSGILKANLKCFGKQVVPSYYFNKAAVIVSFSADFLGTWLSPVEFISQYAEARSLQKEKNLMAKHFQFEAGFSVTGSNADERIPIHPLEEGAILMAIYNDIAKKSGAELLPENKGYQSSFNLSSITNELWLNKGKSLVVSASNDESIQIIVNGINQLLNNYDNTINLNVPYLTKKAVDEDMLRIIEEMNSGDVGAILLNDVNPVYDYPEAKKFIAALKKVDFSAVLADRITETALYTEDVLALDNYLESWGDFETKKGEYSFAQPSISKLFDTCSFLECLLKWTENETSSYDYIKSTCQETLFPLQTSYTDFDKFWSITLQAGMFETTGKIEDVETGKKEKEEPKPAINEILNESSLKINAKKNKSNLFLEMVPTVAIGNGMFANNPWLQELPDPITKVTWDNVASIPVKYAKEKGIKTGQLITINDKITIPALVQPGQESNTITIALGYGRKNVGKAGNNVGQNSYPLLKIVDGEKLNYTDITSLTPLIKDYTLAFSQTHDAMEGRSIIRETSLKEYIEKPSSGNEEREEIIKESTTLYPAPEFPGHHWGLSIDLNACTGCNSCLVACQAENNVPVVGKEQVQKRRLMHWIRLDRYYAGNPENPEMVQMPIMCQQCDSAPCENVCPVAATMRSNEGINQMAYNRCIGTRYCMSNCPYKMRRFNWFQFAKNDEFDFNMNDDLGRMVLNPDVVVRSRGVAEKCSFCTQRIQEGKLNAKLEDRPLKDGEILPACAQACPAKAIVFGDLNDSTSEVSKRFNNPRHYHLLEQLHTQPSVGYLTKVRNIEKDTNNKELL